MNLISARQFKKADQLEKFFGTINHLPHRLQGSIMATLFYQPSTRTRMSFESAMYRLGGNVISSENAAEFSSAIKGETLEDTIRIVSDDADVIVLRHPAKGSSDVAAKYSKVHFINAGDGDGEHPTQAMLDMYTIKREVGFLDNLRIALVGDMKYGRTVHSLLYLLDLYNKPSVKIVCPPDLGLPSDFPQFEVEKSIDDLIKWKPNVIYMTRAQKGFAYDEKYVLTTTHMKELPDYCRIMHPLPRQSEIDARIDSDHRACYFKQAGYGVPVRKAILCEMFSGNVSWSKL